MRKLPQPNDSWFGGASGRARAFSRGQVLATLAVAGALLAFVGIWRFSKPEPSPRAETTAPATVSERPASAAKGREVYAAWYHVPEDSLAHRRADGEEFTAAHNKLPIGTLVRVTRLKNSKSVTVRITDRGIHNRRVALDLCQEAAEELEMIHKGIARVRMEVIPDQRGVPPPESNTTAAQP